MESDMASIHLQLNKDLMKVIHKVAKAVMMIDEEMKEYIEPEEDCPFLVKLRKELLKA